MTWTQLLAPAGGRRYLHADLGGLFAWNDTKGLSFCEGKLVRIDRALGTCARVDRTFTEVVYAIAVSPEGRYAFSDGRSVVLEGLAPVSIEGVAKLAFGAQGDLWAMDNARLYRIDGRTGALVWKRDTWGTFLALDGDTAALVSWGSLIVVTGDGEVHKLTSALALEVHAVKARDGRVYVMAGDGTARRLAALDLSSRSETVFELPPGMCPREIAATRDGAVAWRSAPLGLTEFDTRSVLSRDMRFPAHPSVGLDATRDDRAWVALLEWESALVRIDRETGRELDREADLPLTLWSLSVASDGRVASAHDREWRVTDADGTLLHREVIDSQVCDLSFSVDGRTLAVMRTCPEGCHLDLVECERFTTTSTRVVSAGRVRFLPDGVRIALIDTGKVSLCDAATLAVECVLAHGDKEASIMGLAFADGRIAAYDYTGRVVCFDDPGVTAPSKKPPKHKPAVTLLSSRVSATTHRASNAHIGAVFPFEGQLAVFDAKVDGISRVDLATKKPVSRTANTRGYFMLDAPLYLRAEAEGCSVWRLGETAPRAHFAQMPTMAACSRDGRFVAVALHGGVYLTRISEAAARP